MLTLYLLSSSVTFLSAPALYRDRTFQVAILKSLSLFLATGSFPERQPANVLYSFSTIQIFTGKELSTPCPNPQTGGPGYLSLSGPSRRTYLAWEALSVEYTTASIAPEVIRSRKPHRHDKAKIPSGGGAIFIVFLLVYVCSR